MRVARARTPLRPQALRTQTPLQPLPCSRHCSFEVLLVCVCVRLCTVRGPFARMCATEMYL
jgi:hypothetical protein